MKKLLFLVVIIGGGLFLWDNFKVTPMASVPKIVGYARVIDGDTLYIGKRKIRLAGIDAPESKQTCRTNQGKVYACGTVAARYLNKIISNNKIACTITDKDRYNRLVGICYVKGVDINREMVRAGWAVSYYSLRYRLDGVIASLKHSGMRGGYFEIPSDWRKQHKKG